MIVGVASLNAERSTLNFQRPIQNLFVERWTLNSSMPGIVVKPRARILHGHDWVFSSEVQKVFGKPPDGRVVWRIPRSSGLLRVAVPPGNGWSQPPCT
jgi:hypothetical protein